MKKLIPLYILIILLPCLEPIHNLYAESRSRFEIKSIHFEGNKAFSRDRLRSIMVSKSSSFLKKHYYHAEVFHNDLDNIALFYKQQGYLESKIADYQVKRDTTNRTIRITINIYEGNRAYVKAVSLSGNHYFTGKQLGKIITLREGDPLLQKKMDESTKRILDFYSNHGFLDARVQTEVKVLADSQQAFVNFIIREGPQYRIADIQINSLVFTNPQVVTRELTFKKGEVVDYSRLLNSQRQLYLTGLFQSVFISLKQVSAQDSTQKLVLIDIREKSPAQFNVSGGYGSIEKFRVKSELYNDNISGTARKAGVALKYSSLYQGVETSFTEPWTFNTRFRTDLNLKADYAREPGYDLRSIGGLLTVGRQFMERSNVLLSYRHENNTLSNVKVKEIPEVPKNRIRSIKLSFIYDTRDNIFNSTNGAYINWSNELAGLFFAGQVQFFSSALNAKYFYPATSSTILAMALDLGWISAPDGIDAIPLNERFYTGGPNEMRAFRYQKVGPLDQNGVPLGGKFKLVWDILEIRQTVYKMFGMAVFGEVGNIYIKPSEFKIRNLRQSLGAGLRINSPIGLLRLDYAFNLDPDHGEPKTRLYFSVGQAY